ncbi:MAG: hypothetical protein F6J86_19915 [Symploca sp. SIO1B1]|nr:hypothetical protein [Symploca sp. SIO1C2]NER96079.1 hypothetical protein [Symploca sp. SIO1B1]
MRTAVAPQMDRNIKGSLSHLFGCNSFKEKKNEIYTDITRVVGLVVKPRT